MTFWWTDFDDRCHTDINCCFFCNELKLMLRNYVEMDYVDGIYGAAVVNKGQI